MKIALFGRMRSGKNTVADILTIEHNFKQFAFGTGIKEIIEKYFPEAFENGKPRIHFQHIGQQLRELNEDVWINYTVRAIEDEMEHRDRLGLNPINVVITDGRQLNEAKKLKEAGYIVIKVVADEETRIKRIKASGDKFSPEMLNHDTELQVDLIEPDIVIENNGTYAEVLAKVQEVVSELKGAK